MTQSYSHYYIIIYSLQKTDKKDSNFKFTDFFPKSLKKFQVLSTFLKPVLKHSARSILSCSAKYYVIHNNLQSFSHVRKTFTFSTSINKLTSMPREAKSNKKSRTESYETCVVGTFTLNQSATKYKNMILQRQHFRFQARKHKACKQHICMIFNDFCSSFTLTYCYLLISSSWFLNVSCA